MGPGPFYDTDVATMERNLNRALYLTVGVLPLPPLLIVLAIHRGVWHLAFLAPILIPFPAAWLAHRAKRDIRMGLCYAACALLFVGTPAATGLLAWLSGMG